MTVYVDDMCRHPAGRFGRMKMSHMIGTDETELHAMAAAIGVQRRWYQGDHYDVAMAMRAKAIARGAVEITWRQCGAMTMMRRVQLDMGDPATAVQRYREARACDPVEMQGI